MFALCFWLQLATAVAPFAAAVTAPSRYIFAFGDSYTETGFNVTAQPQPSIAYPLGNPSYPGTTHSGGANWLDVAVYNRSRSGTVAYNYAGDGGTVNNTEVQDGDTTFPDFISQANNFLRLIKEKPVIRRTANESLFIMHFGINDVAVQIHEKRTPTVYKPILRRDISDYFGILTQLYDVGARHFITILVPPIYRAGAYSYGTSPEAQRIYNATQFWNRNIQTGNTAFQNNHVGSIAQIVDPSPTYNNILDHPHSYGAPNSTCLSIAGQPCLWADFIHPGLALNQAFGNQMGDVISGLGF